MALDKINMFELSCAAAITVCFVGSLSGLMMKQEALAVKKSVLPGKGV